MKTFIVNASCQGDLLGESRTILMPFPAYEAKTKEEAEAWGLKTIKFWFPEDHYSNYKIEVEVMDEVLGGDDYRNEFKP
jgi:hypothetical protein